jgi:hypothetical protein
MKSFCRWMWSEFRKHRSKQASWLGPQGAGRSSPHYAGLQIFRGPGCRHNNAGRASLIGSHVPTFSAPTQQDLGLFYATCAAVVASVNAEQAESERTCVNNE